MPAEAIEDDVSREIVEGESATYHYDVVRADSELEALGAVQAVAPLNYQGLPRGRIRVTPEGGGFFRAEVPYSVSTAEPTDPAAGLPPEGGGGGAGGAGGQDPAAALPQEMQFSTGISGGVKFLRSKVTIASYLSFALGGAAEGGLAAPDYRGYMNVQPDGTVNGVELPTPDSTFSITKHFPVLTYGWYATMLDLVWKTNMLPFRGLEHNEVVFLGATGNYKGDGWPVTCNFGVSRTKQNIKIDGDLLVVPIKEGWDYVWVSYYTAAKLDAPPVTVVRPLAAYVERILDSGDFDLLGLNR